MFKKVITILEWIIICVYSGAFLSLSFEKIASNVPFIDKAATITVVVAILLVVAGLFRKGTTPLPGIWSAALSITALFAHECASYNQNVPGIPPLFLVVIITVGLIGTRYSWIFTGVLFVALIPIKIAIGLLVNELPVTIESFANTGVTDFWRYFYIVLCGGIASALAAWYRSKMYHFKPAVIPQKIETGQINTSVKQDKEPVVPPPSNSDTMMILHSDAAEQEISDLLSSVVYFMSRNFRSYSSLGFIYDQTQNAFVLNSFQSKSITIKKNAVIPLGVGAIGKLGTERRPFMTGDISVYNTEMNYYREEEQINSLLGVPIISDNELLGALVLDSKENQAFKDQDKDTMRRFSTLAAALIKSERMRFLQEKSAMISNLFYQASHQLTTALKIEDVFNVLFNLIPGMVVCKRQISIVFDAESNTGTVVSVFGESPDIAAGFQFPVSSGGIYAFAFQKRKTLIIADFQQYAERYYRFSANEANDNTVRSLAIFPIKDDEQRCRGLFSIECTEPNVFTQDMEQILTILIENASVAFTRAMLYQKMERLATTDGLTGLNNHRTFQESLAQEIERSRRYSRPLSLLLMDIDHFKTFNDTYGHPVGDLVLKEIAACIRKAIRVNDIPARYGGEEFVVIIPETNERGSLITAERIRSTIEQHTVVSLGRQLKVTVSIGCSAFPENAPSQQALIDTADKALYAAKKGGRNRVVPFKTGM